MRSLRIAALAIIFSLVGTSAHSNTPPLPGFNADGSVNTNLPTPIAPPAGFVPPPGYVPPLPSQFNSDGALAFRPDGTPLAGFNADGSANTNLPAPIEPPGFLAPLPPPLFNQDGTPFVVGSKLEMPIRADGTRLEYNFDPVSGLYIPVQGNTPINPVVPPPNAPPGFLAPLPPPLFNSDGTPFVVGSKLEMPVRADGTRLEYNFDPISGWYIPVQNSTAPLPSQFNKDGALAFRPDGTPLAGFNADGSVNTNLPKPVAPANPVIYNPDGTLFTPNTPGPLPPPLFNSDGSAFVVGSKILTPLRADGTQIAYDYDAGTGLYWPVQTGIKSPVVIPAPGVVAITFIYDDVAKQMIPVTYRSAQIPAVNFDGSANTASKVMIPDVNISTPITSIPKAAQIGSWAVVAKNGAVINSILCSQNVCGANGDWGGKIVDPTNCPNGCALVLQVPANPITGQSMGGYLTGGDNKVTYKNGEFKVASPGSSGAAKNLVRTIKNGVLTDVTGERIDLSTGFQLPSLIRDAQLKKKVDTAIAQVEIETVKSNAGYQLTTTEQLPAIDASLKVTAVKMGAKTRSLKIDIDKTGELFLPTTADLTGYEIQIKRGSKVLKRVLID